MSHMTQVLFSIKSIDALENACYKLGLNFRRGKTKAKYYDGTGRFGYKCDHVIEVPGYADDIAVKKNKDGTYTLLYDQWLSTKSNKIKQVCGVGLEKLHNAYQISLIRRYAEDNGLEMEKEVVKIGNKFKTRIRLYKEEV